MPAAAVGLALCAAAAYAEIIGNSAQPYEARVRLIVDRQSYTGRIRHRPGMQRQEFDAQPEMVRILRFDLGIVWTLDSSRHRFVEDPLRLVAQETGLLDDERIRLAERPGDEEFGRGNRYAFAGILRNGGPTAGNLWLSPDGILLRVEGVSRLAGRRYQFRYEVGELRRRPQPASIFAIPAGYRRVIRSPVWGVEASTRGWEDVEEQETTGRSGNHHESERRTGEPEAGTSMRDDVRPPPEEDPGSLESLFRRFD